jgi:hypothetical protein
MAYLRVEKLLIRKFVQKPQVSRTHLRNAYLYPCSFWVRHVSAGRRSNWEFFKGLLPEMDCRTWTR